MTPQEIFLLSDSISRQCLSFIGWCFDLAEQMSLHDYIQYLLLSCYWQFLWVSVFIIHMKALIPRSLATYRRVRKKLLDKKTRRINHKNFMGCIHLWHFWGLLSFPFIVSYICNKPHYIEMETNAVNESATCLCVLN